MIGTRYRFRKGLPEDAGEILGIIKTCYAALPDKSFFAVEDTDEAWIRRQAGGDGFVWISESRDGEASAVLIVCCQREAMGGLWRDAGIPDALADSCAVMDTLAVLPAHRGEGLSRKLLLRAEAAALEIGKHSLLATVAPGNRPSLHNFQKAGYRIVATKEKYSGRLRHILRKEISLFGAKQSTGTCRLP